jgi:nucleoside-diphosphate-sugar epimerase
VTGASGLIGIYVVSFLKKFATQYNIEIYCWMKGDLENGFKPFFEGINIIKGDITQSHLFNNPITYDVIIHSSGYGQPGKFLEEKIKTIQINTTSTINLFSKLNKGGKFLFMSTSEIYSGLDLYDITEDQIGNTNTNHLRSCYIEGKRTGESICHIYKESGFDVKIIRLSLAYGPGTKKGDQRVLNSLIEKGINEKEISLIDRGESIRTYCYITDVIEMIFNILLFGKDTTYNVGGISKLSIFDLANNIGEILSKQVTVPKNENTLTGSPNVVNISIKKYSEEFNKKYFVDIKDGLERTIKYQKKLYKNGF